MTDATEAAPTGAMRDDRKVERTPSGETVNGIRVTAYVENVKTPLGPVDRYSGHWSTPGKGAKNVRRLFAEEDVFAAIRLTRASDRAAMQAAVEALEPFAKAADALSDDAPGNVSLGIFTGSIATYGPDFPNVADLRNARAALDALKGVRDDDQP